MRMLSPRELFNAQGFPRGYVIDPFVEVKNKKGRIIRRRLNKTEQVFACGNSVSPYHSRALTRATFGARRREAVA